MSAPHVVTVIGTFSIPTENAAAFRENCAAMVALRDKEPGHLATAYGFGADGMAVSREDYESAEAVLQHMQVGSHIFESTRALVTITGVELHGPADELDKLRDLFGTMSPRYFVTEYGFRR
ncbi:antibiotic biosynthesis monooxygenase [Ruegeria sp. 2205SS24-7]|uniref:antibiotic biosynthesis monooxygenase n=1 Tax=Ruegeria discodermiae TaxID=3064389 RepID=UPI002741352C|nr:antibiotic biosynthesis monooxygenase [Ruegeria sp. 2205SS24-7]MDP5217620.1 antibiotic biosynthesis monooxygenase [Ruegeria sp. 2205SS24-7]